MRSSLVTRLLRHFCEYAHDVVLFSGRPLSLSDAKVAAVLCPMSPGDIADAFDLSTVEGEDLLRLLSL